MNKPLIVNPNTRLYGDLSRILKSAPKPLIDNGFIPSYAELVFKSNSDFVQELNKINALTVKHSFYFVERVSNGFMPQLNKINQLSFFDSFNCVDTVAVTGNNLKQEPRNLLKTVQHHTIVGVFFCLSFANCLFTGELRLALALVRLWWGGRGNKPLGANTVCRLFLAVSSLPTALILGQIIKTSLPLEKV